MIAELGMCLDKDGIDCYFLNRPPLVHLQDLQFLANSFSVPPAGGTPLSQCLDHLYAMTSSEKKTLVLIFTDGEPSSTNYNPIEEFRRTLHQKRPANTYITIVACSDDDATLEYLNGWDDAIPRLDVCDDYYNERAEIREVQGPMFSFSFGDYIVKCLLGSIDPVIDKLDEMKPVEYSALAPQPVNSCCAIM